MHPLHCSYSWTRLDIVFRCINKFIDGHYTPKVRIFLQISLPGCLQHTHSSNCYRIIIKLSINYEALVATYNMQAIKLLGDRTKQESASTITAQHLAIIIVKYRTVAIYATCMYHTVSHQSKMAGQEGERTVVYF